MIKIKINQNREICFLVLKIVDTTKTTMEMDTLVFVIVILTIDKNTLKGRINLKII